MSNSNGNGGEDNGNSESAIPEEFEVFEEKRAEDRNRVSFEWCELVRDIGEAYRESGNIEEVADKFEIGLDEGREAAIVYRLIFEDPPRDISFGAHTTAIDFFDGSHNIESVTRGNGDKGVEESKRYIREFTGAVYRVHDVEGEDEIGDIPDEIDLDKPELDFDFDNLFPAISAFEEIGPLFSEKAINNAFAGTQALADAMSTMSYQEELQNIAIAVDTLPTVAEQLRIPDETFAEITEAYNSVDTLRASLANVPDIYQFGSADQTPDILKNEKKNYRRALKK